MQERKVDLTGDPRIGIGYDIHPLSSECRLMLGGVEIESPVGLSGHSDADALVHAVCDAVLGALCLGDLGEHFPETDEFRDISSLELLRRVRTLMEDKGYRLGNVDSVIHAEAPKLAPYRDRMAGNIAEALGVSSDDVSVKATRGEGMGPVGEGRAMAARAIVILFPRGG